MHGRRFTQASTGETTEQTESSANCRHRRRILGWSICVLIVVGVLILESASPELSLIPGLSDGTFAFKLLGVFLAALLCEYIDSSLGMGYGTTLTPLLLLAGFEPLQVVPAVLLSEFLTGLAACVMHHRDGNMDLMRDLDIRRVAILLSILGLLGAAIAVFLALSIPKFWLTAIIAVVIFSVGAVILATIRRSFRFNPKCIAFVGMVAAFNKGLSGGGYGPLVTAGQIVSGVSPKQAVGVTSLAEGLTCLVGVLTYVVASGAIDWSLALPLTTGALFSVPVATLTVRWLPEYCMRSAVGIGTCALGLLTLIKLAL